jgi:regulator of RNase E activity RraA
MFDDLRDTRELEIDFPVGWLPDTKATDGIAMNADTIEKLRHVSVATLATALYKRGLRNQVIQDVRPVAPKGRNMVGPAFTLRYMPAREDRNTLAEFRSRTHPQRVAIEQCPAGHVLVMDSRKDARAASAGDILITRLMVRGGEGVVTDGGFRDAMNIGQLEMPAYHNRPSSPTNLTTNEAIDINVPIGCGDCAVFPGDIVVGDDDSVIVIPAEIADEVAAEAVEMTAYEDFVMERVKGGQAIIGLYPGTDQENLDAFAQWRKTNNR